MAAKFEIYKGKIGDFRWRLTHSNGRIIATSGEGYTSKVNAINGLNSVKENAPNAVVEDRTIWWSEKWDKEQNIMNTRNLSISGLAMGILAVIAGLLVLIWPELVRWIIGIFLIVWGVLAIVNRK
jgi:uncharacterized protein